MDVPTYHDMHSVYEELGVSIGYGKKRKKGAAKNEGLVPLHVDVCVCTQAHTGEEAEERRALESRSLGLFKAEFKGELKGELWFGWETRCQPGYICVCVCVCVYIHK